MNDGRIGLSVPAQLTTVSTVSSLDDRRKILALQARADELEVRLAAALRTVQPVLSVQRDACRHYGVTLVSDNTPSITCRECGAELDPFDVLRRLAHEETVFCHSLSDLREERRKLGEETERLKAKRSAVARDIRRSKDEPPAGLAARLRAGDVGELMIRRVGKTHEWLVSAKHAIAGTGYHGRVDGPESRSHGTLEDALETVLVAMAGLPEALP